MYILNEISFLCLFIFINGLLGMFWIMLYSMFAEDFYFSILWFTFSGMIPLLMKHTEEYKDIFIIVNSLKKETGKTMITWMKIKDFRGFVGGFLSLCTDSFIFIFAFEFFINYAIGIQTSPWLQ